MGSRRHLIAVNRTIKAAGLDADGLDAATVELARDLARRMDAAGADGPALNLTRAYLSVTKDLSRATARRPLARRPETPSSVPEVAVPTEAPALKIVEESALDKLRRKKASSA